MAAESDFSEQEWKTLRQGVMGAGLTVSLSDRGFFDSFKEAGALAKHIAGARGSSQSELVRKLAEGRPTGFGMTDPPAEIESQTLDALRRAVQILQAKAPDELESNRLFVLDVAQSVAGAAGGGEAAEGEALGRIRSALA